MCPKITKIRENQRQNDNFIHIAIKKRVFMHPATMFRNIQSCGPSIIIVQKLQRSQTTIMNNLLTTSTPSPLQC